MKVSRTLSILLVAAVTVVALHCSKSSGSPTQPATPATPSTLNAAPPSVTLSANTSQNVTISGGAPPYSISSAPSAIATAQISNADSAMAIIHIVGVTVASVSTSVVIKDNTTPAPKSVTIPITVQ